MEPVLMICILRDSLSNWILGELNHELEDLASYPRTIERSVMWSGRCQNS